MLEPSERTGRGQTAGALLPQSRPRRSPRLSTWRFLLLALAQAGVALLMRDYPLVATLHAVGTIGLGLAFAFTGRRPERVACAGAYITGAEVLWRMTDANVFWELGKLATAAIFLVYLFRSRRREGPLSLLFYFALLVPSSLITIAEVEGRRIRQELSFNLAGPLALMVCAWFFFNVRLPREARLRLFLTTLVPVAGISALVLTGTLEDANVVFGAGSNLATSGGFAPNQVSAVLGLGALLCFFVLSEERLPKGLRLLLFAAMIGLASQSALTFSRGGLYMALGSATVASLSLMRDARSRVKVLVAAGLFFLVAKYVVLPRLDAFTEGSLVERFQDTGLTKRGDIARADLQIWKDHPLLGVGPGLSKLYRDVMLGTVGSYTMHSHTEFTRLLSEHGFLGFCSLILLLYAGVRSVRKGRTRKARALSASFIVWSLLFMAVNAMRLVTPSFIFGLAFADFDEDSGPPRLSRGVRRPGSRRPPEPFERSDSGRDGRAWQWQTP